MDNEAAVYEYLQGLRGCDGDWVSPTLIGREVGGKRISGEYRHSSWASPICKRLVEKGKAERSSRGWYKALP